MSDEVQAPKRTGFLELIKQSVGSQFVIPVYQRNYTWSANKEVKQFLNDLHEILIGHYQKHFMGIMIYLDTPIDFSSREFSVIDGQQRLTTTFLFLYAVKEIMINHDMTEDARNLEGQYLINPFAPDKIKYKLKPLVSDDTVYQKIVSDNFAQISKAEEQSNIYKNYCYIKNFLEGLLGHFSINEILTALEKLYIVCVPISQNDYPQKIFESINATGAKLTASDLIRNFMLMPITSDKQEVYYSEYWHKIENILSPDSKKLEAFFRLFLAAKNKSLPNKNAVYSVFVDWFEKNKNILGIEGIFKEILKYAEYYYTIYKQDLNEINPIIRKSIKEFRYILSEMPAPLFLEMYALTQNTNKVGQPQISMEQFNTIVELTNTYLIRRALCNLDTSDITRLFPSLLNEICNECAKNYDNVVNVFKRNLVNKNKGNSMEMPDDKKLYDSIINANMYTLRLTVRMFFDKLELSDNPAPVDLSTLSIEHLMPQTPTDEWYAELNTDEETYQRNLHRLGNLTLAAKSDNSKMQNNVWEYKNAILSSTGHLTINKALLTKEKWTLADIDNRTKELISEIQRLYPYFEESGDTVIKYPIYIDYNGILATGKFYEIDGSVEIDEGSILNTKTDNFSSSYPKVDEMRQDLIADGVIGETESGLCFLKNYIFYPHTAKSTALSTTAELILYGSKNGWDYWKFESGKPLKTNKTLKEKFS